MTFATAARAALAALVLAPLFANAQGYPAKPVRIIAAFPPGGAADLLARVVADKLSSSLGSRLLSRIGPAPAEP